MAPNNDNRNKSRTKHSQKIDKYKTKRHFGCGICQANHSLTNCRKFQKMNLADKYKTAVKLHYCINCLARNHLILKCPSKSRCQKCNGKHHTTLHGPDRILKEFRKEQSPPTTSKGTTQPIPAPRMIVKSDTSTILSMTRTQTIVPTVVVQIGMEKSKQLVRALLNPSLTTSKIGTAFVRESTLNPFKVDEKVYVKVLISPNMASKMHYEVCMQVSNDLPRNPYSNGFDPAIQGKFCRISLADPEFYSNTPVAMEIGGDLYTTILQPNTIHIDGGSLIAQDSTLGWLIMGSLNN